jgi:hypothetical protein
MSFSIQNGNTYLTDEISTLSTVATNITSLPFLTSIQNQIIPVDVWPYVSTINQNLGTTSDVEFQRLSGESLTLTPSDNTNSINITDANDVLVFNVNNSTQIIETKNLIIDGGVSLKIPSLEDNAFSNLTSGVYTPTFVSDGIYQVTTPGLRYLRIGNVVKIDGTISFDNDGDNILVNSFTNMSLPYKENNFDGITEGSGIGTNFDITSNAGAKTLKIRVLLQLPDTFTQNFSFSYQI